MRRILGAAAVLLSFGVSIGAMPPEELQLGYTRRGVDEGVSYGSHGFECDVYPAEATMIPWMLRLDDVQTAAFRDLYEVYRIRRAKAGEQFDAFMRRSRIDLESTTDRTATERRIEVTRSKLKDFAELANREWVQQVLEVLSPEQQARWPIAERFIIRASRMRSMFSEVPGMRADLCRIVYAVRGGECPDDPILEALERYNAEAAAAIELDDDWVRNGPGAAGMPGQTPEERSAAWWRRKQSHEFAVARVNVVHGPRIAALLTEDERDHFLDRFLHLAAFDGITLQNHLFDIDVVIDRVEKAVAGSPQEAAVRADVDAFHGDIRRGRERFLAERMRDFERWLDNAPPGEPIWSVYGRLGTIGAEEFRRASDLIASFRQTLTPEQLECLSPALREKQVEPPVFE